jgi:surface antigen
VQIMIVRRFVPHAFGPGRASRRSLVRIAVAVAASSVVCVAGPAGAASDARITLKGAPFKAFTEEDTRQFVDAARTAADSTDAADETRWANEASGAWGTLTVKRSFKRNGATCRELRGENNAGGRTDPFRMVLCKIKGDWKLISSGPVRN